MLGCILHSKCRFINLPCFTLFQFKCNAGEDATVLIIVLDANFEELKPKQRILAIKNLSGFLSLQHVRSSVYFC
jgi:hypothetical protein